MSEDLLAAFDSVLADGGDDTSPEVLSRNANVYFGDEDTDTDTDEVDVEVDDSEVDDSQDIDSDTDDGLEVQDDAPEDTFDFDSIKDKTVSVTVNGETFEVPLAELRNGYMRQSDYTRKTQQIAADRELIQWAQELQEAFRVDPAGSLRYLQEQFGLQADNQYADLDPEFEPIVNELKQTRRELAELRKQQEQVAWERVNADVQSELNQMKSRYQDFDPLQVLPIAIDNKLTMEMAYKVWKADRVQSDAAAQEAARLKAEQAAAKRDKARAAAKKVPAVKAKAEPDDSWKRFNSFEDIFEYEVEKSRS